MLLLSSAVSSAGIQLLQSQPPRFTLLPTRSVYPVSLTRREVQSIPSLLISKVVREGAIYVFILVVLFGLVRCPMHGRHGAMDFWLIRITVNQLSGKITSPTPYVRSRCRDLRADLQRNRWRASHPGGCIRHWHGEPFLRPLHCPCPSRRHRTSRRALRD